LIVRDTAFTLVNDRVAPAIQQLYAALAADDQRNQIILDDVMQALEEKRSPILLTERRDHLEFFAAKLRNFARHSSCFVGAWASRSGEATAFVDLGGYPCDDPAR
jgi:hypothetical protein